MKKHLGYTAFSSGVFFLATLIVLLVTGAGPQMEGLVSALDYGGILKQVVTGASLFGTLTGLMATLIFRKSMNHRTYTLITIILALIFTEAVIVIAL
jgi:formate-dependent nitrite reductase membrane component NrfD